MLSRFAYVDYDKPAAKEQNQLRDLFKRLEAEVAQGKSEGLVALQIPANEYSDFAETTRRLCELHLKYGQINDALRQLEVLYFLLGKNIRIECVQRMGLEDKAG